MNHKQIRAKTIVENIWPTPIIVFSCGNASYELQKITNNIIAFSQNGDFTPNRRFSFQEIHQHFPNHFDATSGNLPINLLYTIAQEYKKLLREIPFKNIIIPCWSGELALALSLIIPIDTIIIYGVFEWSNTIIHPTLTPIFIEKNNHLYDFLYNNFKKINLNPSLSYQDNIKNITSTLPNTDLLIISDEDANQKDNDKKKTKRTH